MTGNNLVFELIRAPTKFGIGLRIGERDSETRKIVRVAAPVEMRHVAEDDPARSCLQMEDEDAQALFDALYRHGFRPSGSDSAVDQLARVLKRLGINEVSHIPECTRAKYRDGSYIVVHGGSDSAAYRCWVARGVVGDA